MFGTSSNQLGQISDFRQYPRLSLIGFATAVEAKAQVQFRSTHDREKYEGNILSLSQGGLFVRSAEIPELGSLLFIEFNFCKRRIRCQGKVIYRYLVKDGFRQQGFGVKFSRMGRSDFESLSGGIQKFLEKLSPKID